MEIIQRGTIRKDGFIFWKYEKGAPRWESPEAREKRKQRDKLRNKKRIRKYDPVASKKYRKKKVYDPIKAKEYRNKTGYNPIKAKEYRVKYGQCPNAKRPAKMSQAEKRKKINTKVREKFATDPLFKLKFIARNRLGLMVRKIKAKKPAKTIKIIGCSWVKLKKHIENQFTEGMTWENHGLHGWHIDHIIPLACATEINELIKLCHYSNLRPIWAKENRTKKDKLTLI
jgi:hypothetical protein